MCNLRKWKLHFISIVTNKNLFKMWEIAAFSNPNNFTFEKLEKYKIIDDQNYLIGEIKLIFCGGLSQSTIDEIYDLKDRNYEDFIILLSPYDIDFLFSIVRLFYFIRKFKKLLNGKNCNLKDIQDPVNILNFEEEYDHLFEHAFIDIAEGNCNFNHDNLYSLLVKLEEFNTYNYEKIVFILQESEIVYELNEIIFSAEHNLIGYKSLEELQSSYKNGIHNLMHGGSSSFIKKYCRKHKIITYAKINSLYVIGDSDSGLDYPYFKVDDANKILYLNNSFGRNEEIKYLKDGKIVKHRNENCTSFVVISGYENKIEEVSIFCKSAKGSSVYQNFNINQNNNIEIAPQKFGNDKTRNYAIKLVNNYCAIPVRKTKRFIVTKIDNIKSMKSEKKIGDLIDDDERSGITSVSSVSDIVSVKSILKKNNELDKLLDENIKNDENSFYSKTVHNINKILDETESQKSKKSVIFSQKLEHYRNDSENDSDIDQYAEQFKTDRLI